MPEPPTGRLEPALVEWYRAAMRDCMSSPEPGNDAEIRRIGTEVEETLERGDPPPLAIRRRIAHFRAIQARRDPPSEPPASKRFLGRFRGLIRGRIAKRPYHAGHRVDVPATRVLHAIVDLRIGGAQQLVIDLVRTAPVGGRHEVLAQNVRVRFEPGVPYREVPANRSAIERAFDRIDPELVHVCHYHADLSRRAWYELVFDVAITRRIPVVQSHCVIGDPWMGSDRQHLVFCSAWSRDRSAVAGIPDSVISPGTPIDLFQEDRRPLSGTPHVGMVYRLDGDKIDRSSGDVIARILEMNPTATMTVVGDGVVRPQILEILERRGVSDRVEWRGFIPFERLPEVYRAFDLAIAPVLADTFGSGSVHAICAGTPVCGYAVAAIPSILRHDAAIIPNGDAEAFARGATRILTDDRLHEEVHRTQLDHAVRNFSIEGMCASYHTLFRDSIARSPRSA